MRLREHPPALLGPNDVQLPENPTTKQAADLLLTALMASGWVDADIVDAYAGRS